MPTLEEIYEGSGELPKREEPKEPEFKEPKVSISESKEWTEIDVDKLDLSKWEVIFAPGGNRLLAQVEIVTVLGVVCAKLCPAFWYVSQTGLNTKVDPPEYNTVRNASPIEMMASFPEVVFSIHFIGRSPLSSYSEEEQQIFREVIRDGFRVAKDCKRPVLKLVDATPNPLLDTSLPPGFRPGMGPGMGRGPGLSPGKRGR
jgi:hypothetical protein